MQIKDALGNYVLKMPKTFNGQLMKYKEMSVEDFKIDKQYQRHISPAYIKRGGELDLTKLTPIVACKRPDDLDDDSGYYVVDGQHRTLRVIHSDYDGNVPVCVYEHPEDSTLEDCVKFEAKLFHQLNSLGKKPTKVDEVRAGIYSGDKDSLFILDVMKSLNVTCDNFGSEEDNARELEIFTHFHIMCLQDYKNETSKILDGYKLLNEMYPKEKTISGYMLRACCLMSQFEKALTDKKKDSFSSYIRNQIPNILTVKALVRGKTSAQSPQFILHDIITRHNNTPNATKIGKDLLLKLSNKDLNGNPRFKNPLW